MSRIVLIGGASHTGKSSLAARVAEAINGTVLSTDTMARHPGRPWPKVAFHVAEHYSRLSDAAIFEFLFTHHGNMWPRVEATIREQLASLKTFPLVLEGSALRPDFLSRMRHEALTSVWLTAAPELIGERILSASGHAQATASEQVLIDAFRRRSVTDDARIRATVDKRGLTALDGGDPVALDDFVATFSA